VPTLPPDIYYVKFDILSIPNWASDLAFCRDFRKPLDICTPNLYPIWAYFPDNVQKPSRVLEP